MLVTGRRRLCRSAVRKWGVRKLCLLMLESLRRLHPTTSDRLQPLPSCGNHAHPSHHLFKKRKKERGRKEVKKKKPLCKVSGLHHCTFFVQSLHTAKHTWTPGKHCFWYIYIVLLNCIVYYFYFTHATSLRSHIQACMCQLLDVFWGFFCRSAFQEEEKRKKNLFFSLGKKKLADTFWHFDNSFP